MINDNTNIFYLMFNEGYGFSIPCKRKEWKYNKDRIELLDKTPANEAYFSKVPSIDICN